MSFVKKFSSVLPATKHQSRIVENSYMIQFPDISPPIHGFHSFVLRVENQPYLCYNSSSSHRCTGPQESSKSLGSRAHITLAYDFILMLFFLFFFSCSFSFLFVTLFLNSLSGCPIAAAEKLAMSQEKNQLESPKAGQCHDQTHR